MQPTPPVGLRPKWLIDQQRAMEIILAMSRFVEAGTKIPRDWFEELSDLYGE